MNPEGIQSSSPGLAFFSQPWGEKKSIRNPEKGCVGFEYCLNDADATPSGLDLLVLPFPRVG
jgi:hypothetical protein